MTLGVVLFVVTLLVLRDHRVLQRFTYTSGLAAIVLLLLPLVPGLGATINGARIWIRLGPFSFQPGEVAKVLLVDRVRRLPRAAPRRARAGRPPGRSVVDLPRGRDLGPILLMWLISLGILVFQHDLGSSLLFFGLFLIMLYVATERPGWLRRRRRAVPRRRAARPTSSSATCRSASTSGCTRSATTTTPTARELPARRVDVRDGAGAACSAAASATAAPSGSRSPSPTSSSAPSARSSA